MGIVSLVSSACSVIAGFRAGFKNARRGAPKRKTPRVMMARGFPIDATESRLHMKDYRQSRRILPQVNCNPRR